MNESLSKSLSDHAPSTKRELDGYEQLDAVYSFMDKLYVAYGRMRFRGAAFMQQPIKDLSNLGEESISDHMWAATVMWEGITPLFPHITAATDPSQVSRYILMHDIGEIAEGDISIVRQINGDGKGRREKEEASFLELTKTLPGATRVVFETTHQLYEEGKNDPVTQNKEVLLAKIMDMIQGDHFVLTQSVDFATHSDLHNTIVSTKLIPYAKRLIKILRDEGNEDAAVEIELLIEHHLYQYQKKGTHIVY